MATPSEIRERIEEGAHWRVVVRPGGFSECLVPTLSELKTRILDSKVTLRGWDCPPIEREDLSVCGSTCVEAGAHHGWVREYWRFYQSGQFMHLCSYEEDLFGREGRFATMPLRALWAETTLYRITELLVFSSRLALYETYSTGCHFLLRMTDTGDRELCLAEPRGRVAGHPKCQRPELENEWHWSEQQVLHEAAALAMQVVVWVFEQFNATPWMPALEEDQRKLLERRLLI